MSAKKIILLVGGIFVLGLVIWVVLELLNGLMLGTLLGGMSEITDRVDVESPDHRYVATGFHVSGGATVSDSTIVVIHVKGQPYGDPKNDSVLIADNFAPFHLSWNGNLILVVHCSLERTYSRMNSWNDVMIEYVEK